MLTCTDHSDGRLYINPLVCVDTRVDEDETVKVGLLYSTQRILDGVIILQQGGGVLGKRQTHAHKNSSERSSWNLQVFKLTLRCWHYRQWSRHLVKQIGGVDLPACSLCLCTFLGYCRSAQRSRVLHELLYTATQERKRSECIGDLVLDNKGLHPLFTRHCDCS